MNEEQIRELSQLAEEIADSEFNNTQSPNNDIVAETFVQAATQHEDTPTVSVGTEPPEEQPEHIELNVTTSLVEEATVRFNSAEWFDKMQQQNVIIAGLGGIGSWVTLLLGRCHPSRIALFDGDTVEGVNMAGQLYGRNDIGKFKNDICYNLLNNFCDYFSVEQYGRFEQDDYITTNIMICGFDNMSARKLFYNKWKVHAMTSSNPENCLFIDGRLNAEEWQIFAIRGIDIYRMEQYEREWLFEDSEVEEALCSYKQTSFCASMIASYIVNIFVNFIANLCNPIIDRDLPFLTEYDAKTMYLKTVQ